MSKWAIDPELSRRRLKTLVRLLEAEARTIAKQAWNERANVKQGELDANEMQEWAQQCRNLLNGPVSREAKPIETLSDEELLA